MTSSRLEQPWWYKQVPRDFMSSPDVQIMTAEECGSYFFLLQHAWLGGENATLPNDPDRLAKLARVDKVSELVLSKFEIDENGRFYNPRLRDEWKEALKRSKDGKNNAKKRWQEDMPRHSGANTTALPSQSQANATNTHTNTHTNKKKNQHHASHTGEPVSANADSVSASSETPTPASGPSDPAVRVAASLAAILGRDDLKPATKAAWAEQAEVLVTKHGEAMVLQVMNALLAENRDGFWRGRVFAMKNFVRCFTTMHKQFVRDAGKGRAAANPLAENTASLKTGYDFSAIAKGDL
jgi:uncharacterized protein YdaU (DUF1376 family)